MSFIQEDVYIGHTALTLTLGLQVFSQTRASTTGRLLVKGLACSHVSGKFNLIVEMTIGCQLSWTHGSRSGHKFLAGYDWKKVSAYIFWSSFWNFVR